MTSNPPTWETRLCDDQGMVSHEVAVHVLGAAPISYLDAHNNMSAYHAYGSYPPLVTEPFFCTGSAHFGGMHIRCTSPAHASNRLMTDSMTLLRQAEGHQENQT